jgi:GntR family transcriptional regulator
MAGAMDFTPPAPRYLQLAQHLREAIQRGDYKPGEALPGEPQLAERFGLSRPTIRQAIAALRNEGLVTVEHGRGTYVRERRPVIHVTAEYLTQRAQWPGEEEVREVATITAPDDIAVRLLLEDEASVVVRRRVMLMDGEPVQLADSYYPASLVQGSPIAQPGKLQGGTLAALERLGVTLDRFAEELAVRMPTPEERQALRLVNGVPVIVLTRTAIDSSGTPAEVSVAVLNGERHILNYEFPTTMAASGT